MRIPARGIALALVILGLTQMAADLAGFDTLAGLAAATTASPAPRVFSAVDGLETYSTRFFIEWTDRDDVEHSLELTSLLSERLQGPHNRRNAYGAAIAYGPVLFSRPRTRPMFESLQRFALCGEAPLLRELGIDPATLKGRPSVKLEPLPGTHLGDLPTRLEAPCP